MAATVLILAFVALLAYGMILSSPDDTIDRSLERGQVSPAPGFELPVLSEGSPGGPSAPRLRSALADGRLGLEELRGSPVVVNFWASWCPPCLKETPALEQAWRSSKQRGVVFVGLNMQDVSEDARGFLEELNVTYPNVRDRSDDVASEWGVIGLPETYFIDRRGDVVAHVIGALSAKQLEEGTQASITAEPLGSLRGGDRRPTR